MNVWLKAITRGQITACAKINIEVCGYEVLSALTGSVITHYYEMNSGTANVELAETVSALFSTNVANCPITTYTL